jgi:hypothetical protein
MIYTDAPNNPEVIQMKGIGGVLNSAENESVPARYVLPQNYPNPFRISTTIDLPGTDSRPDDLTLRIYDALGRLAADMSEEMRRQLREGEGRVVILRGQLPGAGMYYYVLSTPAGSRTRRMLVTP